MPKEKKMIAYLIVAHDQPEHFFDLISQLNHKEVCFFVHIDKKSNQELFASKVRQLKNVFFVQTRINVIWGGFPLVQATLNLMELALGITSPQTKPNYNFKYFVLLSGACYPIKSNQHIIQFFQNSNQNHINVRVIDERYRKYKYLYCLVLFGSVGMANKAKKKYQESQIRHHYYQSQLYLFIANCLAPKRKWQEYTTYYTKQSQIIGRSHYWNFFHLIDTKHYPTMVKKIILLLNFCLNVILPAKKKPKNIKKFYHGNPFWSLKQETVEFLYQFLTNKKNKSIIRFYKFSSHCDERIFQTVLKNTEDRKNHQITNKKGSNHCYGTLGKKTDGWPKVLNAQDFPKIKQSERLFARKFDFQKSAKLKQKIRLELLK